MPDLQASLVCRRGDDLSHAKRPNSSLNLPARLNGKLAAITAVVAAADFAPTTQAYDVFDGVSARIQPHLDGVEEIIEKDVSEFENLVHELEVPAIVPRTT